MCSNVLQGDNSKAAPRLCYRSTPQFYLFLDKKLHEGTNGTLERLHLPLGPRVSPTGQLELNWQLIGRTMDNHLVRSTPTPRTHAQTPTDRPISALCDVSVDRPPPRPTSQVTDVGAAESRPALCSVTVDFRASLDTYASKHL